MRSICLSLEPEGGVPQVASSASRHRNFRFNRGPIAFRVAADQALCAGWHLLAMEVAQRDWRPVAARLSIRHETSVGQQHSQLPLHFSPGSRQRLLVQLPSNIRELILILSDSSGFVSLGPVRLRSLSRAEALARVIWPGIPRPILSPSFVRFAWTACKRLLKTRSISQLEAMSQAIASSSSTIGVAYGEWIQHWEEAVTKARLELRERLGTLRNPPRISVLLPVFNAPESYLERCIESVRKQSYPHWELCIADDASSNSKVREIIRRYAEADKRINAVFRPQNGHISAASNSALALASSSYVALLDHDDELAEDALAWVAWAINCHPGTGLIYSDEDKITPSGERFDPYFKPDFDRELLRGQNVISHLGVYRTELVHQVGGFREGLEGSQDHDLALRISERLSDDEVIHLPVMLYHWRTIPGSTAQSGEEKSYAADAALRAVSEHANRTLPGARVEPLQHGRLRVRQPLPTPPPKVSLIVPTRDRLELLRPCVDSLLGITDYPNLHILVVDNGSSEQETIDWLARTKQQHDCVDVIRIDEPFNFSRLNNVAVNHTHSELIGMVNNDIEATEPGWLTEMVSLAIRPQVGAVGALLSYPDHTIQHAGVTLGLHGVAGHPYCGRPDGIPGQMGRLQLVQSMSAVTGACLLSRRKCFLEVGGLDESLAVAFNDVDYCLKLRAVGYKVLWTPHAHLLHRESATRGLEDSNEKLNRFRTETEKMHIRWKPEIENDPAYNPNLSLFGVPFALDLQRPPAELGLMARLESPSKIKPPIAES